MLRDLADAAGHGARAARRRRRRAKTCGASARTCARPRELLADRPTLQRLLARAAERRALPPFLDRFWCKRAASMRARCSRAGPSWPSQRRGARLGADRRRRRRAGRPRSSRCPRAERAPLLGARAALPNTVRTRLRACGAWMSDSRAPVGAEVGAAVQLIDYRTSPRAPVDAFTSLHSAALADGRSAVAAHRRAELYAASVPVFASSGEAVALIEARCRRVRSMRPRASWCATPARRRCCSAGLAVLAAVHARRVRRRPVRALTAAAAAPGRRRLLDVDSARAGRPRSARSRAPWRTCAATSSSSPPRCAGARPKRRRCSPASSKACSRSTATAASATSTRRRRSCSASTADDAVGRFCGDVLKPRAETAARPCEEQLPDRRTRAAAAAPRPSSSSRCGRRSRAPW